MSAPKIAFRPKTISLRLEQILPVRQIKDPQQTTTRYKTILASIKQVGVIEPLMVFPQKGKSLQYLLMDGHYRYHALKELGWKVVDCIVCTEDESFTFNARISRVAPIQEHKMIMKAVRDGVSPERIAAALNLPLKSVNTSMRLLEGINPEAADLLKDKVMGMKVFQLLRKVSGVRQIEIAELLVSANTFTAGYVEALCLATPRDQLVEAQKPKVKEGLTPEMLARMESEREVLERDFKSIEHGYGENVLTLTIIKNFVKRLLDNGKIVRFLNSKYSDLLPEFEKLAATEAL